MGTPSASADGEYGDANQRQDGEKHGIKVPRRSTRRQLRGAGVACRVAMPVLVSLGCTLHNALHPTRVRGEFMRVVPDRISMDWITTLTDVDLLDVEARVHAKFALLERREKKLR